ncbi:hypothetical protein [Streptomyces sp. NPDC005827]|uniref:hypothetical protein n=1 Tax=Streptomyces sp. NPDC005827 TaxID=3157070 RepID=UPI0033FEE74E
MALATSGYPEQARAAISWIAQRYTGSDWHTSDPQNTAAIARQCDAYENLWLAWGAQRSGMTREARGFYGRCRDLQDPVTGGVRSRVDALSVDLYDLRSTALTGLVGLSIGDEQAVSHAAEFTLRLMEDQPDTSRGFFLVRDGKGQLITSFPEGDARLFVVGFAQRQHDPLYYALALGMAFLATVYDQYGEAEFLSGARRYAAECMARTNWILRHHYTGKIGWGMSLLYRITGEHQYRAMAEQAVSYLLRTQLASGAWWIPTLYESFDDQPRAVTLDRSAEHALWLRLFSDTFRAEGTPS